MMNILKSKDSGELVNGYPVMKKIVSFLTAGLVDYADVDDGKYLLRKEAIERMLPTLEGRPLVIGHQTIDVDRIDDVAVGYITKGYWNPDTGSFDCDVLVKDPEILNPEHNAVSCAYVATEFGEGGRYSGIDYDAEILNGKFTHIALVDTPRYNDAKILVNGLKHKGDSMIKRFFSNAAGTEDEKKAEDEKKSEDEQKDNEDEKSLNPDDVVKVGEDEVTVKDLVDCYKNSRKNEDKEAENEEEKKDNEDEKKDNCGSKKNEDSDDELVEKVTKIVERILAQKHVQENKKNEDEEKKDNEEKEEKQNSLSVAAFMRDFGNPQDKEYETRAERIAASNKKYGL